MEPAARRRTPPPPLLFSPLLLLLLLPSAPMQGVAGAPRGSPSIDDTWAWADLYSNGIVNSATASILSTVKTVGELFGDSGHEPSGRGASRGQSRESSDSESSVSSESDMGAASRRGSEGASDQESSSKSVSTSSSGWSSSGVADLRVMEKGPFGRR